jgi:hypothetical protein
LSEVDDIRSRNWTQGSFVEFTPEERETLALDPKVELYLLASHPCDIVLADLTKEPNVEILPVTEVKGLDGNLTFGKNPRRLEIAHSGHFFNVDIVNKASVDRLLLAGKSPSAQLNEVDRRLFASWLAARYNRPAFADEFNVRMRQAAPKVSKVLKSSGDKISGIYVATTLDELPATAVYEVAITITMRREDFDDGDSWTRANEASDAIAEAIGGAHGIELIHCDVTSEAELTLNDLRDYARWDYDSLSFKDGDLETLPAAL